MDNFRFGFDHIDNNLQFTNTDFIVLGQVAGMGFELLLLNSFFRVDSSICYICTENKQYHLESNFKYLKKSFTDETSIYYLGGNEKLTLNHSKIYSLELPTIIELIEFIYQRETYFDYFIIDNLSYIGNNTNNLFNPDKNYQIILRHLKILNSSLKKNIVVLANFDQAILKNQNLNKGKYGYYHHYASKEKYIDYLITLYRPEYYGLKKNVYKKKYKKGYTLLNIGKTKQHLSKYEYSLIYNSNSFVFL